MPDTVQAIEQLFILVVVELLSSFSPKSYIQKSSEVIIHIARTHVCVHFETTTLSWVLTRIVLYICETETNKKSVPVTSCNMQRHYHTVNRHIKQMAREGEPTK